MAGNTLGGRGKQRQGQGQGQEGQPSTSTSTSNASFVKRKDANPSSAILVSRRQMGNPLLKFIKNVRWMFVEDMVPDYQMGQTAVALFLSLKYHLLHPQYIHFRIRELQRAFRLRVLLVHIDVDDPVKALASVTKLACVSDLTLICGWSYEECARYLETFKTYETKQHDLLLGNKSNTSMEDYTTRVTQILTQIRGVNRTDVLTLTAAFGTLKDILQASEEQLSSCPGLGPAKVKRLYDAFHSNFFLNNTSTRMRPSNHVNTSSSAQQQKRKQKSEAPPTTSDPKRPKKESTEEEEEEENNSISKKRQRKEKNGEEGSDFDINIFL